MQCWVQNTGEMRTFWRMKMAFGWSTIEMGCGIQEANVKYSVWDFKPRNNVRMLRGKTAQILWQNQPKELGNTSSEVNDKFSRCGSLIQFIEWGDTIHQISFTRLLNWTKSCRETVPRCKLVWVIILNTEVKSVKAQTIYRIYYPNFSLTEHAVTRMRVSIE